jgi:cobalamin biosynthesis Co2+ chelatase CbiK
VGLDIARIILKRNNEEMRKTVNEPLQTLKKLKPPSNINQYIHTVHIIGRIEDPLIIHFEKNHLRACSKI